MKRFGWGLCALFIAGGCSEASTAELAGSTCASKCDASGAQELPSAGELLYLEKVLGDAEPDEALPMVVALHGLGSRPQWFAKNFEALPEHEGFTAVRLVLLQAPLIEPHAYSWNPVRAGDNDVEGLSEGIEESAALAAEAIEQLRAARPTLGEPIVTGFSQGGMVTFGLAIHHPDTVGVAIPMAGWLPPPLYPDEDAPPSAPQLLVLHGEADTVVPVDPTRDSVERLDAQGWDVELRTYEGLGHDFRREDAKTDLYDRLVEAIEDAR